jgi:hypothetical protein
MYDTPAAISETNAGTLEATVLMLDATSVT